MKRLRTLTSLLSRPKQLFAISASVNELEPSAGKLLRINRNFSDSPRPVGTSATAKAFTFVFSNLQKVEYIYISTPYVAQRSMNKNPSHTWLLSHYAYSAVLYVIWLLITLNLIFITLIALFCAIRNLSQMYRTCHDLIFLVYVFISEVQFKICSLCSIKPCWPEIIYKNRTPTYESILWIILFFFVEVKT